jgi:hypothetical protein
MASNNMYFILFYFNHYSTFKIKLMFPRTVFTLSECDNLSRAFLMYVYFAVLHLLLGHIGQHRMSEVIYQTVQTLKLGILDEVLCDKMSIGGSDDRHLFTASLCKCYFTRQ